MDWWEVVWLNFDKRNFLTVWLRWPKMLNKVLDLLNSSWRSQLVRLNVKPWIFRLELQVTRSLTLADCKDFHQEKKPLETICNFGLLPSLLAISQSFGKYLYDISSTSVKLAVRWGLHVRWLLSIQCQNLHTYRYLSQIVITGEFNMQIPHSWS